MLARLGTMLGDLEPVAPQEAFLNRLEDLLVARAKHVDARVMLRQVAVEVDGESEAVTTTTIAQLARTLQCCFAEKTVPIGPFLFRLNRGRTAEKSG